MDGGALIGQGTYGCVFDPPLLCKSAVKRRAEKGRLLGKITDAETYQFEEDAAIALEGVPGCSEYFVLLDYKSKCDPAPVSKQKDSDIWKCEMLKEHGYGMEGSIHFRMRYGGVDAFKIFKKLPAANGKFNWNLFFGHTLEAAALLTLNSFVHYDISSKNILIDEKTGKPRIIDFGMSFSARSITEETLAERWKEYTPFHPQEPPEVSLATGVHGGGSAVDVFGEVLKEKEPLREAESWLGLTKREQGRRFAAFWRDSATAQRGDWVGFFRTYWPAFDAWNVGVVLFRMFRICSYIPAIAEEKDWIAARPKMKEVLRGLLRMDPRSRLDCVEALNLWNPSSAILEGTGEAWLDARAKQRGV